MRKPYKLAEVFDLPPNHIGADHPDFDEAYIKPFHVLYEKKEWDKRHFARRCNAVRAANNKAKEVRSWYTI